MKTFYFTGTGNSLYVAKQIGGELHSIPQVMKQKKIKFDDDVIGIVFPCYAFGAPRMVIDFIEKADLKANYFFAIMTYGNLASAGLHHIEKTAAKKGIKFSYTNEIVMVDNYLPMFDMDDQRKKEKAKKIGDKLKSIVEDINNREEETIKKGFVKKGISKLIHKIIYKTDNIDKKFRVDDNCNACKTCEKVCPKANVLVKKKPEFLHKCDECYSCIQNCPQKAIHLTNEKSNARYRNKNVTLKEIIGANDQGK